MPRIQTTPEFESLFNPAHPHFATRYKSRRGGRGSGKSWQFARGLLFRGTCKPLRILCTREFQNSIADSVIKLLDDQAHELGLSSFYEIQKNAIYGANGTEFLFKGLRHNIQSIKSIEGIDIVWVEEAQTVSEESWKTLVPTIRKPGSQIWISYNPSEDSDPTHQRFCINPPPESENIEVNWNQNPWFPDELEKERKYMQSVDPDEYDHVWNGQTKKRSHAQVLNGKWVVSRFSPDDCWDGPYQGADWGFAQDPTTLIRCWIHDSTLYIEHEAYGVGVDIVDTPKLFEKVPGAKLHKIRADNARPETINHIKNQHWTIEAAPKWQGSVEDGISVLRSFRQIVIHERCKNTIQEARAWSYKVDRLTGDVLPILVDKHNHTWDAVRYALAPIIQARKGYGALIKM